MQQGHVEILEKLIAHGADIHHVGKNDITAIQSALRRQSMLVVNKLIQYFEPDELFKELSDPSVVHFVKRLSDPSRASFLTELSARLTPIQLATLNFEPSQQAAAASSRMSGP